MSYIRDNLSIANKQMRNKLITAFVKQFAEKYKNFRN